MDKRFLAILAAIVVVFGGIIFFTSKNDSKTTNTAAKPSNHVTGKLDSKVTFVNYGDFQCPACQSYSSTVEAVRQKYAGQIKFQFRHLPLVSLHPNAMSAARASEAAAKQGKFWEMHDLLYSSANWTAWTTDTDPSGRYQQYAQQLGLDVEQFKKDFMSSAVNGTINADIALFDKTGQAKATPTFFINDRYIPLTDLLDKNGSPSVDTFSAIIDKELAKTAKAE